MLLAQKCIPPKWTHSSPPTHNKWIHEALRCITLEKITFSLKGLLETVYKIWQLFSAYTDSPTISAETSNRHLTNRALPLLFIISFNSNTQCSKIVNTIIVSGDQPEGVCEGIYMWCKCVMIWVGWEGQRQYQWWVQLENDTQNFVLWILWISQWRDHSGTNPRADPHTHISCSCDGMEV